MEATDDSQDAYLFHIDISPSSTPFKVKLYKEKFRHIGHYLSNLEMSKEWSDKMYKEIRHKAYGHFLKDGYLWKKPKRKDGVPLRVVDDAETKQQ